MRLRVSFFVLIEKFLNMAKKCKKIAKKTYLQKIVLINL